MRETAETFLRSRRQWIDVGVVERGDVNYFSHAGGAEDGFDIVVRIDGAYFKSGDAVVAAAFFKKRLADLGFIDPPVALVQDLT